MLANADLMLTHAEGSTTENEALTSARERALDLGARPVSPAVGAALTVFARMLDARAVVEIGTGVGLSGLCLLRGMRDDGVLTTIDTEPEHLRSARRAFRDNGIAPSRTRLINGRALEVLPRLADSYYDLVFVDGNIIDQPQYVAQSVRLLRPGGALIVHAALLGGRVGDPSQHDSATIAAREAARLVAEDERLFGATVPLGEGLLVASRV